jgi:hypothetical protein
MNIRKKQWEGDKVPKPMKVKPKAKKAVGKPKVAKGLAKSLMQGGASMPMPGGAPMPMPGMPMKEPMVLPKRRGRR